jgi:hypothetical protein
VLPTVICNGLWIGLIQDNRDAHKSVLPESHDKNRNRHPTASVVLPYVYIVPQACTHGRSRARLYEQPTFHVRALAKYEGSATIRGRKKKTPQDIRMQPKAHITLLTKLNDLRCVLDRSVPTYALPQHSSREEGSR